MLLTNYNICDIHNIEIFVSMATSRCFFRIGLSGIERIIIPQINRRPGHGGQMAMFVELLKGLIESGLLFCTRALNLWIIHGVYSMGGGS